MDMVKPVSVWDVPLFLKVRGPSRESEIAFEARNPHDLREEVGEVFKTYSAQGGIYLFDSFCLNPRTEYDSQEIFNGGMGIKKISKRSAIKRGLEYGKMNGIIQGQIILPHSVDNLRELIEKRRTLVEIQGSEGFARIMDETHFKAYYDRMPAAFFPTRFALHGLETSGGSAAGIAFKEDYGNQQVLGAFSRAMNPIEE